MSISCSVSIWSETKLSGTISTCLRPSAASARSVSATSGASHFTGPERLWKASRQGRSPIAGSSPSTVALTWSR